MAGQQRELASVRLRLLLDTVLDAAGGLRRELALPPGGDLRPADTVAAVEPSLAPVGGLRPTDDPALLDELLALPQVHLVVDGYNVTKTAWPSAPLHSQRQRLVTGLGALVAQRRIEVTVVFDGAELSGPVRLTSPRGVRVRFSPPGVIADEVIRQLVRAEPAGRSGRRGVQRSRGRRVRSLRWEPGPRRARPGGPDVARLTAGIGWRRDAVVSAVEHPVCRWRALAS